MDENVFYEEDHLEKFFEDSDITRNALRFQLLYKLC